MIANFIASVVGFFLGLVVYFLLFGKSFDWAALYWFAIGLALAGMLR